MARIRLLAVDPSARGAGGAAVDGMVGKCVHLEKTEWWATAWKRDGVDFKLVNIQARRSASNEGVLVLIEGEAEKPETERVETAALSR